MSKTPDLLPTANQIRMPFGRIGWLVTAIALIGGGAALNWGWLTAIGVAPLILALAPCAVMCAVGLCAMGGSKTNASRSDPTAAADSARDKNLTTERSDP